MIAIYDFEEETPLSSLTKLVTKGLTPYAVPLFTDTEIDTSNEQARTLDKAITMMVKDHTNAAVEAKSPKTFG